MPTVREVRKWSKELDRAAGRIGPRSSRVDLRYHAGNYLRGLISRVERKNGWQLAEELGEARPTNVQHFIARSKWNADEVCDDPTEYVSVHLGENDGVLIIDETGFLKKGRCQNEQTGRLACRGSIRERPAGSRIVRSAYS